MFVVTFQYLGKLDTSRASEEDSLVEIGVALCAVDRLLGGEETTAPPRSNTGGTTPEVPSSGPQKVGSCKRIHSIGNINPEETSISLAHVGRRWNSDVEANAEICMDETGHGVLLA